MVAKSFASSVFFLLSLIVPLCGCAAKVKVESKPSAPPAVQVEWPAGTILVSRNKDDSQNKTPGYQNHLAMYLGKGVIVESQEKIGVVQVSFEEYKKRPYDWFPFFPLQEQIGQRAADKAKTLIGIPYRKLSSLFPEELIEERGLNCVSVIRVSYAYALGHPLPDLKLPDDILAFGDVFTRNWVYATPKEFGLR